MNKRALIAAAFVLSSAALSTLPSRADMPSFSAYFAGTWSCTTHEGSHVVKVYGANENARALVLFNAYTYSSGYANQIYETYVQHGAGATVVSQFSPGNVYVADSPGFVNDRLVFSGTQTVISGARYERMTYARTDQNHFTRTFETGPSAAGPLASASVEDCTRISSAPVPTPHPSAPQ